MDINANPDGTLIGVRMCILVANLLANLLAYLVANLIAYTVVTFLKLFFIFS